MFHLKFDDSLTKRMWGKNHTLINYHVEKNLTKQNGQTVLAVGLEKISKINKCRAFNKAEAVGPGKKC